MSASRTTGAHGGPTPRSRAVPAPAARWPLLLPLVIVFVVLVLLAGGSTAWHALNPVFPSASGSGPQAPAVNAPTVDGDRFSLAAQRGKVVVLYAMAAWCTSCVPESAALGQLARADKTGKLATLLVDESPQTDAPAAVRDFRARTEGPARSWVIDRGAAIAQAYGITTLNTTVVIGHVAARYGSSVDLATLQAAVRPLL